MGQIAQVVGRQILDSRGNPTQMELWDVLLYHQEPLPEYTKR